MRVRVTCFSSNESRKKFKGWNVIRANHGEVASIQSGDLTDAKSFGQGYDGCVHGTEGKIVISAHELRNPYPIASMYRLGDEISGSEVAEKPYL
jgi:hypothetical protein